MANQFSVLILENDEEYIRLISNLLSHIPEKIFKVETISTLKQGKERLKQGSVDFIIMALNLPDSEGYNSFNHLHEAFPDISIITLSDEYDISLAVKIIIKGGEDYLVKSTQNFDKKLFADMLHLAVERVCFDQQKYRLANFAEWNTHPIIELNMEGEVVYLNLTARGQFPDLPNEGLRHQLLQGLRELVFDYLPVQHSQMTIFNREVVFNNRNYEEQLFILPNSGVYIYLIDTTERNRLKSQALLSDRLATVGTLAAGVAHEINNPIAWILENLRFLKENLVSLCDCTQTINQILQENDPNQKMRYLEMLTDQMDGKKQESLFQFKEIIEETLQGAERIRDIVRDLKGFARVDKAEVGPVDVNMVINTAISMAVPEFKYKARLEKNLQSKLPPLLINSGKLHQVFLNLVVNAAQAIPEGDVQNNKISVSTSLDHDRIRIDVSDTGQGIPPELMSKIFDPFFTTKPAGYGTGLGLSICHDVITQFGGEIKVQSTPGKGTTFSIYLPAYLEAAVASPKVEAPVKSVVGQKQILIIDDEISLIKTMERMLQNHHKVKTALGGKEALDLLMSSEPKFDAIICDLNMPNISGADLYRYVAGRYPGYEQKFIFITAGVYSPLMKTFLANISNPVLEKPFTAKDLLNTIDKVLVGGAHVL